MSEAVKRQVLEHGKRYRKKPIVILAWKNDVCPMDISTLEGTMTAELGDYIIVGIAGEVYPCKPDIFEQSYEEVSNG